MNVNSTKFDDSENYQLHNFCKKLHNFYMF